ncbi:MAG: hypothetical protein OXJ64_06755, partial [Boseongicola sp.]|nr:hypothetical protein [Boseongicola sp.]
MRAIPQAGSAQAVDEFSLADRFALPQKPVDDLFLKGRDLAAFDNGMHGVCSHQAHFACFALHSSFIQDGRVANACKRSLGRKYLN